VRLGVGGTHHDGGVDPTEVALLTRALRSFALDSVPGAGHFIQEERPDAVVGMVVRLGVGAPPPRPRGSP
jgi:pimeloyl-ACP methyl ester carboxylesterase